jgi:hypothetical protein
MQAVSTFLSINSLRMRKSHLFILFAGLGSGMSLLTLLNSQLLSQSDMKALQRRSEMVRRLDLTDLSLFTEARYSRHLSQADLHSGLQDHPMALEHFPSGSLLLPPAGIGRIYAYPDP